MPHKISSLAGRPVPVGTERAVQRKSETAADGAPRAGGDNADAVHITGSAKQLAGLEQALKGQPALNDARIAALRAAIEGGTYRIDAARIADKLLLLEDQLASTLPKKQP